MSRLVVFSLCVGIGFASAIPGPIEAWEKLFLSGQIKTRRPLQGSSLEYDKPIASPHRLELSDDDKPIPTPHRNKPFDDDKPIPTPHKNKHFVDGKPFRATRWRLLGPSDKFWLPKRSSVDGTDALIYNGRDAEKNIAPGMVSIQTKTNDSVVHVCGGSLAAPNKILTAAHCFKDFEESEWQVALGYHKLSEGIKNKNSQVIKVDHLEYHVEYDFDVVDSPYDIAMLTLVENAVITPGFVELMKYSPKLAADLAGSPAYLIGWGDLDYLWTRADTLQYADYKVLSTDDCRKLWPDSTVHKERNICALSHGAGDCMGDSGGPLLDSAGIQIGIVSWGDYECRPKQPAVLTSVGFYIDWTKF